MPYVIKTIGIIFAIMGVVFATVPALMTRLFDFVKQGRRIYAIGVIRIVVGALLIMAAQQAALPWMPGVIGGVIVISGILIFALGQSRNHAFMEWWERKPEGTKRFGAIVLSVLGVLLIYGA
ncbi:MAG: hypothetical protein JXA24_00745, partial [Proteobacteria bacterium]|nr:hypothetical protein [Pseudomonadota bacterium]